MRLISGQFGGREVRIGVRPGVSPGDLQGPPGGVLHAGGPGRALAGLRVLDLFAGTGSLALEALSRGAAFAAFVERRTARPPRAIQGTLADLGLGPRRARVYASDLFALLKGPPEAPFDVVFIDPPYGQDLLLPALELALASGWIAPEAVGAGRGRGPAGPRPRRGPSGPGPACRQTLRADKDSGMDKLCCVTARLPRQLRPVDQRPRFHRAPGLKLFQRWWWPLRARFGQDPAVHHRRTRGHDPRGLQERAPGAGGGLHRPAGGLRVAPGCRGGCCAACARCPTSSRVPARADEPPPAHATSRPCS